MSYPGKNEPEEIRPDYKQYEALIKFMGKIYGPISDIGEKNLKSAYLAERYGVFITQINMEDFNYPDYEGPKFNTILCFEVLEHLQNPHQFMKFLKSITSDIGTIYLSTPGRPYFMWSSRHFYEMKPKIFKKFICDTLGLVIVDQKRIRIKPYFSCKDIGIRPLLRLPFKLFNYTNVYKIKIRE